MLSETTKVSPFFDRAFSPSPTTRSSMQPSTLPQHIPPQTASASRRCGMCRTPSLENTHCHVGFEALCGDSGVAAFARLLHANHRRERPQQPRASGSDGASPPVSAGTLRQPVRRLPLNKPSPEIEHCLLFLILRSTSHERCLRWFVAALDPATAPGEVAYLTALHNAAALERDAVVAALARASHSSVTRSTRRR